ncbi:TPA: hypothetical protein ACGHFO_004499, partial [Salmonella enterica subsp. enterica serovar Onderstepoort]
MAQCEVGRPPGGLTTKLRGIIPDGTNRKAPHDARLGLDLFGRRLKLWRRYQIYIKYMLISSFMQYIADNLLLFAVNVIVQRDVALGSLISYTVWSLPRNAPRNF